MSLSRSNYRSVPNDHRRQSSWYCLIYVGVVQYVCLMVLIFGFTYTIRRQSSITLDVGRR